MIASSLPVILAFTLISGQALAALNQPAQVLGMPFITTDNVIYSMPASFGGFVMTEFNSTSLTQRDLEKLNIDFPLLADIPGARTVLGPTSASAGSAVDNPLSTGVGSTANVLPFGPVDLALPSIRQTVDQSVDYQDTYFFTDSLGI